MDKALLQEFEHRLQQRITEIKEELSTVAKPDKGDHVPGEYAAKFENFGDENSLEPDSDSPDEVENYEVNLAVTGELERELKRYEAALERIKAGTYGKDIQTGAEIALDRLRANPAAETAITKHAWNPTAQTNLVLAHAVFEFFSVRWRSSDQRMFCNSTRYSTTTYSRLVVAAATH